MHTYKANNKNTCTLPKPRKPEQALNEQSISDDTGPFLMWETVKQ